MDVKCLQVCFVQANSLSNLLCLPNFSKVYNPIDFLKLYYTALHSTGYLNFRTALHKKEEVSLKTLNKNNYLLFRF